MPATQENFFHVGAVGLPLDIICRDKQNVPLKLLSNPDLGDLTAAMMEWTYPNNSKAIKNLSIPGSIVDANNGLLRYTLQTGDLKIDGTYDVRLVLTFGTKVLPLRTSMAVLR